MKKTLVWIISVLCTLSVSAANYGVLVNGETYFKATHAEPNGDYDQYNAHVALTAGDHFVLCNAEANETWTVPLDEYAIKVIGRSDDGAYYTVSQDGCYDFWIKLLYGRDQLYIGTASDCGPGEPYNVTPPCPESYGLLIDGEYHAGERNTLQTEWKEYMLRDVELTAGQKIQLYDTCNHAQWIMETFAPTSFEFPIVTIGTQKYYEVPSDGTYDFYLKFIYEADEVYIAKHGVYNSAVPGQCEDVMMQAFYNESYWPDSAELGTDLYGDTRWATLLPQAEEIGRYFDLIWLPPSAYGDGMGYHPKQYSNQNSNWGTREELEALISAFHAAGSKVVADIVINHCAGWSTWCDFPTFDFGEFGVFHPDASYICKDDEVNGEWNKPTPQNPGSGECWGTATGSKDDGDNWSGARDWAHDMPKVQEMFKAYLQWMRKEMKYDGFRYDKGDGFNNWHHDNYNKASGPYIAFMESYNGTDEIQREIDGANGNLMGLDFDLKWHVFNAFAGWDYGHWRGDCLMSRGRGRQAVTFMESHDWFLRPDNDNEFGGHGNSMKPELKARLMQANAFLLSMPGVPCIFYPHWAKYKEDLKPMILARKWAGVHSESEVKDEYSETSGYQATIVGKYGWLILCLGDKANKQGFGPDYKLAASNYSKMDGHNESLEIWVNSSKPMPTGLKPVSGDDKRMENGEKFLRNGQLFIRRGDKVYDMLGQIIK